MIKLIVNPKSTKDKNIKIVIDCDNQNKPIPIPNQII